MDKIKPSQFTHLTRKRLFRDNNMTNQLSPGNKISGETENKFRGPFDRISHTNEDKENIKFLAAYASFSEYNIGKVILNGTKLGRLNELFLNYLGCRCKQEEFTGRLEVVSYIIATLSAISSKSRTDLKPKSYWDMIKAKGFLFNNILLSRTKEQYESWTQMPQAVRSLEEMCLFGEFLYACVMIGDDDCKDPEMIIIREESANEELMLIEEISSAITPRLAVMIFIVFRNWSANGISVKVNGDYVNTFRESFIYPPSDEASKIYKKIHVTYCSFWREEKIRSQRTEMYFKKFLRYLSSEICQSHHFFGRQVIGMNYDMAFKLTKGQCDHDKNKELEHILLNVLEILYYFHVKKDFFEFIDFQDIPIFLGTKALKDHFDCGNPSLKPLMYDLRSANSLLIAISLFVDFLFFEDWLNESFKLDFMEIWGKLNSDISTRCEAIQDFVASYHLFPFFEKSPNPDCMEVVKMTDIPVIEEDGFTII